MFTLFPSSKRSSVHVECILDKSVTCFAQSLKIFTQSATKVKTFLIKSFSSCEKVHLDVKKLLGYYSESFSPEVPIKADLLAVYSLPNCSFGHI